MFVEILVMVTKKCLPLKTFGWQQLSVMVRIQTLESRSSPNILYKLAILPLSSYSNAALSIAEGNETCSRSAPGGRRPENDWI